MEAIEQQRQLLRVDGRAGVLHRDMRLRAVGIQPQRQLSALRAELDGVVHQIVDDLRDRIALRSCPKRPIRQIHIDLKLLGVDLLLERNEHVTQHVAEVEADLARLVHALRLKPGDVQHIADKPRQPAHLAGNDLHIMLLLFGRDRPVEHSVDITADRRHRRFQLVGDVRNKLLTALLRFFKAHRHRIERLRKVGDLLGALRRDLYARAEVSVAEPPGRLRHLVQRADLRTRKERGRDQRQHQHEDGRVDEQHRAARHERGDLPHRRGHDDEADQLVGRVGNDGRTGDVALLACVDVLKNARLKRPAAFAHLIAEFHVQMLSDVAAGELLARAQQHPAVFVADQCLRVADPGDERKAHQEAPVVLQLTGGVIRPGKIRHGVRVRKQRLFLFILHIRAHQEPEGYAGHEHTDQQQPGDQRILPAERCFHAYTTSNL